MKNIDSFTNHFSIGGKKLKRRVLSAFLLVSALCAQAQVADYQFNQSVGTLVPVSTSATILGTGSQDSVVYPITLPFQFYYNGASYDEVKVSSNGFITFGSVSPSTTLYKPISEQGPFVHGHEILMVCRMLMGY